MEALVWNCAVTARIQLQLLEDDAARVNGCQLIGELANVKDSTSTNSHDTLPMRIVKNHAALIAF